MTQDPHPYHDSEKRKRNEKFNFRVILIGFPIIFILVSILAYKAIQIENENKIEVWVEYEVGFQDLDKIIFYKKHDPTDSLVFRVQSNEPFYGTECIHKLEYRLP